MWEVTGGSGPGGAGEAGLPGLGWTPEGRRGSKRVRRGPGSAAPPAALPQEQRLPGSRCCHGNNGGANLLMSPPQLRITKLQWLTGPSRGSSGARGGGRCQVDPRSSPPALQPSSPTPHGSRASPRLPAPPPASFPLRAVGTPPHLSGRVRTGGRGPACPTQSSKGLLRRPASPRERTLCPRCPQPTTSSSGS